MKRFGYIIVLIALIVSMVTAFDPLEVIVLQSEGYDGSRSAFDSQGNVVVVTRFGGPLTLKNNVTLSPTTSEEIVICKYRKDTLDLIWYKHLAAQGSNSYDTMVTIGVLHVDKQDNIFIGGDYTGTLRLDPSWQPLQTFDKNIGSFVVKFNSDGKAQVATQWIGEHPLNLKSITSLDGSYFIAGTISGYVYDGGRQPGQITNGPYRIGEDQVTDYSVFYAYKPDGQPMHYQGISNARGSVFLEKDYMMYGTKLQYQPTLSTYAFLRYQHVEQVIISNNGADPYVTSETIVRDSQGNFYLTVQTYSGTLSIQSPDGTVQVPIQVSNNSPVFVIIKLSNNFDFEWATSLPEVSDASTHNVVGLGIASDDTLIVGGQLYTSISAAYIAKLLPNGRVQYVKHVLQNARIYDTRLSVYQGFVTFGGDFFDDLINEEYGIHITRRYGSSDAVAAVVSLEQQDPPAVKTCPSGTTCSEACCEWKPPGVQSFVQTCYTQAIYGCRSDKSDPTKRCLCPNGTDCCAGACFNPSVHICDGGNLCPVGTVKCGSSCYDPKIFKCCNGSTLKPVAQFC